MRSLAFLAFLLPATALAQEDKVAGLFTEAGQLPLVSQSLEVRAGGGEVEMKLIQVFSNPHGEVRQADYHLFLPDDAVVVGFGFWQGDRFLASTLKEKTKAEAAHKKAASEGRATAIMKNERSIQSFSVYPVLAGERKKVETTFRMPVIREAGRSHVTLPVDDVLGPPAATMTMLVEVNSDEPLTDFGIDGAKHVLLGKSQKHLKVALATRHPAELWWQEQTPALHVQAVSVPLDGAEWGTEVRVVLNDAKDWQHHYDAIHLFVDGSFSMRRRAWTVAELVDRLRERAPGPVTVTLIGESEAALGDSAGEPVARGILTGKVGHRATWDAFDRAWRARDCDRSGIRCAIISDAPISGLPASSDRAIVLLSDAHELAYTEGQRPEGALLFQPGVDGPAKLRTVADELVLPVLQVTSLSRGGKSVDLAKQRVRVAEGSMARLYTPDSGALDLVGVLGGKKIERRLEPIALDPKSEEGKRVRRNVYRHKLVEMMNEYRVSSDAALKKRIVEISLREEIPTAFTALQVDDPELSLVAIKPGDPILTVHGEPRMTHADVWYPFGETRRLSPEGDRWTDRFLVPRYWKQGGYRVKVFKTFDDGSVREEKTAYLLDEKGPTASVTIANGMLSIDTASETGEVSSVRVHGKGGTIALSPLGTRWQAPLASLPPKFHIVLRDRAANQTALACEIANGKLAVEDAPASAVARIAPTSRTASLSLEGEGMRVEGTEVIAKSLRFPLAGLDLRSVKLSARLDLGDRTLLGTRGGDVLEVRGGAATVLARFPSHPITGFAKRGDSILMGVLGQGLYDITGSKVKKSRIDVGSRFVTAVATQNGEIFVGTGYAGLWRIHKGTAIKTLFKSELVASLEPGSRGLVIHSGDGHYRQTRRDRFVKIKGPAPAIGSTRMMAAVEHGGEIFVGGFDRGLFTLDGNAIDLSLSPMEKRINALASHEGDLWIGSEGGLLRVRNGKAERVLDGAVHDLASSRSGLAVASARGLFVVRDGAPARADQQNGDGESGYGAVAWWNGALYAGGLDGLYVVDDGALRQIGRGEGLDANWVTALAVHDGELLAGTYSDGVWRWDGKNASAIPGLEAQWVPPHAIREISGAVWIGGLGMPPARIAHGSAIDAIAVPVEDVYDAIGVGENVVLLTSEGVVTVSPFSTPSLVKSK